MNRDSRQKTFHYLKGSEPPSRTDFLQDLTSQLVKARRFMGLTQEKVNTRLGLATRLVNKWECGIKTPSGLNLFRWAEIVNCRLFAVPSDLAERVNKLITDWYAEKGLGDD